MNNLLKYFCFVATGDDTCSIGIKEDKKPKISGKLCIPERSPVGQIVTSIRDYGFSRCKKLFSIEIPSCITSIGEGAFEESTSLERIKLSDTLDGIADYAFTGCTALSSIDIPKSVKNIGVWAFKDCTGLSEITIPDGVIAIENDSFESCSGLTSIKVDDGNVDYKSVGNCLIETATKKIVAGCKTSVIPADGSVTIIGKYSFKDCVGLTAINIPESITGIDTSAFENCTGLKEINYGGTKEQWSQIDKDKYWNFGMGDFVLRCTDGEQKYE